MAYHIQRRIEFSDTDLGGIVHFSRFLTILHSHQAYAAYGRLSDPECFAGLAGRRGIMSINDVKR